MKMRQQQERLAYHNEMIYLYIFYIKKIKIHISFDYFPLNIV